MINLLLQNNIKIPDNGKTIFKFIGAFVLIINKNSCVIRKFINFIIPVGSFFFTVSRFFHLNGYAE